MFSNYLLNEFDMTLTFVQHWRISMTCHHYVDNLYRWCDSKHRKELRSALFSLSYVRARCNPFKTFEQLGLKWYATCICSKTVVTLNKTRRQLWEFSSPTCSCIALQPFNFYKTMREGKLHRPRYIIEHIIFKVKTWHCSL